MKSVFSAKCFLMFTVFCFHFSVGHAQDINKHERILNLIEKAIYYLDRTQVKMDYMPDFYRGEWKSEIVNLKNSIILGKKGRQCYDSNCFVTSSVHNILAEIYLLDSSYKQIPPMLHLSVNNILTFKSGNSFNFWHELDVPANLSTDFTDRNEIKTRRSNHFRYRCGYLSKLFNIHNDADDTAVAFRSLLLYNKVCRLNGSQQDMVWRPDSVGWLYTAFRDLGRPHRNYYNFYKGHGKNTGSFLTWFGPERYSTLLFPYWKRQNLPMGFNDIDCVVNANILTTLVEYNEENTLGATNALNWIIKMVNEDKCHTCGCYYPSGYSLYYALSKAVTKGLHIDEKTRKLMIDRICFEQSDNGNWTDGITGNELQCSLYALNALIALGNRSESNTCSIIDKGLRYIESKAIIEDGSCYWKGGAFFSVGGLARKTQIWCSDAYNTALAVEAIFYYKMKFLAQDVLVRK